MVTLGLMIVAMVAAMFVSSLLAIYLIVGFIGLLTGTFGSLAYVFMYELVPPSRRPYFHIWAMTTDPLFEMFTVLFVLLTNNGYYFLGTVAVGY